MQWLHDLNMLVYFLTHLSIKFIDTFNAFCSMVCNAHHICNITNLKCMQASFLKGLGWEKLANNHGLAHSCTWMVVGEGTYTEVILRENVMDCQMWNCGVVRNAMAIPRFCVWWGNKLCEEFTTCSFESLRWLLARLE